MEKKWKLLVLPAVLAVCCFLMHMSGSLYYNAFGPEVPLMIDFFGRTESQISLALTMQAIGMFVAAVFLALYGERYNKINTVCLGLGILSCCCIGIYLIPHIFPSAAAHSALRYAALLCMTTIGGLAFILVDLTINGVINDVYPKQCSTILPIAHAFYGLGAMIIPMIVSRLVTPSEPQSFSVPYLLIGCIGLTVTAVTYVSGRLYRPHTPYADMTAMKKRVGENPAEIFKQGKAWFFFLACLLNYIFLCNTSAWIVTYAQQELALPYESASFLMTLFFLGALVMRFASPIIFRFLPIEKYVVVLPVLAAVTLGIGYAIGNAQLLYVLLPLGGFLQGGLIGAMMVVCCQAFPERSSSAASLSIFGTCFSTMFTPLVGKMGERFGFTVPMLIVCASLALSAVAIQIAMRKKRG